MLYNETCFAARALVRIFLDLHEKHQVGLLTEPLNPRDVLSAIQLLVDNIDSSVELLNVQPVFKRHQDNFDRILNCLSHLIFLLTKTNLSDSDRQLTRQVVSRLVKIDPRNSSGESLLHLAASRDNTIKSSNYFDEPQGTYFPSCPVAQLLIELGGADLFALDNRHSTPLHTACKSLNYNVQLVEYFLSWNAHIDQVNLDGERPSNMLLKLPNCTINPMQHIRFEIITTFTLFKIY